MCSLSIIIPVYQVESYIGECLDSIVSQIQDWPELEIVVVNDGTKDASMEIVSGFRNQYPGAFVIINQENQGLGSARNTGLAHARGQYVWFVDSDDWIAEGSLRFLKDVVSANPDVNLFLTRFHHVYSDGSTKTEPIENNLYGLVSGKDILHTRPRANVMRYVVKRQHLEDQGVRFKSQIMEDIYFTYTLLQQTPTVLALDRYIYCYRSSRPGSIMIQADKTYMNHFFRNDQLLAEFLRDRVPEDEKRQFLHVMAMALDEGLGRFYFGLNGYSSEMTREQTHYLKMRSREYRKVTTGMKKLMYTCMAISPTWFAGPWTFYQTVKEKLKQWMHILLC